MEKSINVLTQSNNHYNLHMDTFESSNKNIVDEVEKMTYFKFETQLNLMFLSEPTNAAPQAIKKWKELPKFDITYYLSNKIFQKLDV